MLLEYSYDKCNMVIDSFNKSNIASLSIAESRKWRLRNGLRSYLVI